MQRLWVSGYRDYELRIFDPKAPEVQVIKRVLKEKIVTWLNQQTEPTWLITGPQPGVERWALEVALKIQPDYPDFKLGMMRPFEGVGEQWKPARKEALDQIELELDYVGTLSKQPYQGPMQLRAYQAFMFEHADEVLLVFDAERDNEAQRHAKAYYDYRLAKQKEADDGLKLQIVDFDELRMVAEELAEEERERKSGW